MTITSDPPSGSKVGPGSVITYMINIINLGTQPATNVVLSGEVPTDTTYVQGSAAPPPASAPAQATTLEKMNANIAVSVIIWNIGTLGPSQSFNARYQVRVSNLPASLSFHPTFTVDSDQSALTENTTQQHSLTPTDLGLANELDAPIQQKIFLPLISDNR